MFKIEKINFSKIIMAKKDNSIVLIHEKQARRYWDDEKESLYF